MVIYATLSFFLDWQADAVLKLQYNSPHCVILTLQRSCDTRGTWACCTLMYNAPHWSLPETGMCGWFLKGKVGWKPPRLRQDVTFKQRCSMQEPLWLHKINLVFPIFMLSPKTVDISPEGKGTGQIEFFTVTTVSISNKHLTDFYYLNSIRCCRHVKGGMVALPARWWSPRP